MNTKIESCHMYFWWLDTRIQDFTFALLTECRNQKLVILVVKQNYFVHQAESNNERATELCVRVLLWTSDKKNNKRLWLDLEILLLADSRPVREQNIGFAVNIYSWIRTKNNWLFVTGFGEFWSRCHLGRQHIHSGQDDAILHLKLWNWSSQNIVHFRGKKQQESDQRRRILCTVGTLTKWKWQQRQSFWEAKQQISDQRLNNPMQNWCCL